jgi:hypothetical protein
MQYRRSGGNALRWSLGTAFFCFFLSGNISELVGSWPCGVTLQAKPKPALGGRNKPPGSPAGSGPAAATRHFDNPRARASQNHKHEGRCAQVQRRRALSHGGGRRLRHVSPPLTAPLHRARPPPPVSPLRLRSPPARLPSDPRYLPPHPSRETLTRSNSSIRAGPFLRWPRLGTWGVWCCGRARLRWR